MNRIILASIATLALAAPLGAAEPITGQWVTQDRDAVITIDRCGSAYCGRLTRFLVAPPGGVDQRDVNNPDKTKRDRKLLGMAVLTGFRIDDGEWKGRIYDPKSGRDYRSEITRTNASTLEVKGCWGPFCKTQVWKKR